VELGILQLAPLRTIITKKDIRLTKTKLKPSSAAKTLSSIAFE
jgi:hypothetical protein